MAERSGVYTIVRYCYPWAPVICLALKEWVLHGGGLLDVLRAINPEILASIALVLSAETITLSKTKAAHRACLGGVPAALSVVVLALLPSPTSTNLGVLWRLNWAARVAYLASLIGALTSNFDRRNLRK